MITHKELLIPSVNVKRRPPVNLKQGDEIFFQREYEKKLAEVYLWEMKNVNVTAEGIIFKGLKIYDQNLIHPEHRKEYNSKYLLSKYVSCKKIVLNKNETYLLAHDYWSNGYFHWMCDVLPRLVALEEKLKNIILLLPENYKHPFFQETLKEFSFKNIFLIPSDAYVFISNLVLVDHMATTGNYNVGIMKKLRNIFLSHNNNQDLLLGDKIYVTRKKAAFKHIINEKEVIQLVNKYGFKQVCFEDHSIPEQIAICKKVKYFISIHGANLINILFMPSNGNVLEFRKKGDGHNNAYYSLSACLDLNYYYQQCEFENAHYEHPNRFDLIVDIRQLEENINKM